MAMAPEETLGTIRKEVLIRSGMSADGTHPTGDVALFDSLIRSAQRELYEIAPWVKTRLRGSIALVQGETEYEIPSDVHLGSIEGMVAIDDQGNEVPLEYGIRSVDRNDAGVTESGPVLFDVVGGVLKILPAPSATWVSLGFDHAGAVPPFVSATERAVVDSEALIQAAIIKVKNHFEMPGLQMDMAMHARYLDSVRANQSMGTGFTVGGPKSSKVRQAPVRRIRNPGVADSNWRPW